MAYSNKFYMKGIPQEWDEMVNTMRITLKAIIERHNLTVSTNGLGGSPKDEQWKDVIHLPLDAYTGKAVGASNGYHRYCNKPDAEWYMNTTTAVITNGVAEKSHTVNGSAPRSVFQAGIAEDSETTNIKVMCADFVIFIENIVPASELDPENEWSKRTVWIYSDKDLSEILIPEELEFLFKKDGYIAPAIYHYYFYNQVFRIIPPPGYIYIISV